MIDATPALALYARWRLGVLHRQDPVAIQRQSLRRLVRRAAGTRFGRDHGFDRIRDVDEFQAAVPIRRYEDLWREYWQPAFPTLDNVTWPGRIPYYAVSSGTSSGATKYLPVTAEMCRTNRRAALDTLVWHLHRHPHSRPMAGKTLMLGGSTALKEPAPGVFTGDLSGIAALTTPWWVRPWTSPPRDLALESDWDRKLSSLARCGLTQPIRVLSGVPSWTLILLDRMAERQQAEGEAEGRAEGRADGPAGPLLPELELLVHGGVGWEPYRRSFAPYLEQTGAATAEVYPASEGFFAVQDQGSGEGLRLLVDTGLFYEFVPVEELDREQPTRHWVETIETGVNYALVVSSNAGAWANMVGDTVRFVDTDPPRLLITGRTSYMMSAFGEHIIGEEVENAVARAADAAGLAIEDFAMGAVFPERQGEVGGHLIFIEPKTSVDADRVAEVETRMAAVIDARLTERNEDWETHRSGGAGMAMPTVRLVAPGSFQDWMKRRGRLGGQNKVPRIVNDRDVFADLRGFMEG